MNGEYTRILAGIRGTLQNIDQSLFSIAENFDKITKQILKENAENKQNDE